MDPVIIDDLSRFPLQCFDSFTDEMTTLTDIDSTPCTVHSLCQSSVLDCLRGLYLMMSLNVLYTDGCSVLGLLRWLYYMMSSDYSSIKSVLDLLRGLYFMTS